MRKDACIQLFLCVLLFGSTPSPASDQAWEAPHWMVDGKDPWLTAANYESVHWAEAAVEDAEAMPWDAIEPADVAPVAAEYYAVSGEPFTWQVLPEGLMYRSYLAGTRQPRFGTAWLYDTNGERWVWESTVGGRVGLLRYGTRGAVHPDGWQLDIQGGAIVRLDPANQQDMDAVDFRFGVPITYRNGPRAYKFGYNHISSHVGDEFLLRNPGFQRINYVRETIIFGIAQDVTPDVRIYGELGWAFHNSGGAETWDVIFGYEYSPACTDPRGAPFFAMQVHLREDVNFGGNSNTMTGWQWRGAESGHLLRVGLQYYNGKSNQFSFFREHESLFGFGMWFDY